MEQHRIYGDKTSINMINVKDFYNKRAALVEEKGWGTVLLGDEDSTIASRIYEYDRSVVFPKLELPSQARVLELGCGMGRWGQFLLPHCGAYCGVDFSEEMLKAAEKICGEYSHANFFHLSASEAAEKEPSFFGGGFDCVVLSGVCIYVNDPELQRIFERIPVCAVTTLSFASKRPPQWIIG